MYVASMYPDCSVCTGSRSIRDDSMPSRYRDCPHCFGLGKEPSLPLFVNYCLNQSIRGWAYEADIHCNHCAYERFGMALAFSEPRDSEDNPVTPLFSWMESDWEDDQCDCAVRAFVNSRARFAN